MANRKKRTFQQAEQPIEPKPIKVVQPLNSEQARLIQVIHNNDIIFLTGIAGGGKSHIAAGLAAEYLLRNLVDELIISRPIITAEDDFGILPGEIDNKILPFLGPIFRELSYFLDVKKLVAQGKIILMPVAFMRGHTFKNSFVIIDEAENVNFKQLKMILTRLDDHSKMILNGDFTQSDLKRDAGDFEEVIERMRPLCTPEEKMAIFNMTISVRSKRIKKILAALEGV